MTGILPAQTVMAAPLAFGATALCVLGLTLSAATLGLSPIGAAMFLGVWIVAVAPRAPRLAMLPFQTGIQWLFPSLALVSVVWSDAPMASLRAAVQLALTVAIAVMAARLLAPRLFLAAVMLSLVVTALLSLGLGRVIVDPIEGVAIYAGIFSSKNLFSFFISLLAMFSLGVLIDRGQAMPLRAIALGGLALAAPLLIMGRSAGAMLTTAIGMATLLGLLVLSRLRRAERDMIAGTGLLMLLTSSVVLLVLAATGTLGAAIESYVTEVLGKSMTLTGRTVIWAQAAVAISDRPLLGHGYHAFWQQGNLTAEAIWRAFGITLRTGFHFHNTYIESTVVLGVLGCAAIAVTLLTALLRSCLLVLREGTAATATLAAVSVSLLIRSWVEVDTTYPFAIGTFMLFAIVTYGVDAARARARQPRWQVPYAMAASAVRP